MRRTIRFVLAVVVAAAMAGPVLVPGTARAEEQIFDKKSPKNPNDILYGGKGVSERSAIAGIVSFIVPGIGQLINKNKTPKIVTHLVVGALPYLVWFSPLWPLGGVFGLFHLWSGWDALIDRSGGYISGCVGNPESGSWLDAGTGPAADGSC